MKGPLPGRRLAGRIVVPLVAAWIASACTTAPLTSSAPSAEASSLAPAPSMSPEVPSAPSEESSPIATVPAARGYAMMADVPSQPGVIMLGGADAPGPPNLPDMWSFEGAAGWRDITPAALPELAGYPQLTGTAFVFDRQSGVGVFVDIKGNPWHYDPRSNSWQAASASDSPTELLGTAMAYDSDSDRMIVFGGFDFGSVENNETWAYDVDAGRWERMEPAQSPSPRNFAALAYDADSDRVILFGGAPSSGAHGDTWAYDYEGDTWTEMSPTAAPSGRTYSAIAYDPTGDRMILFGGSEDAEISSLGDTWAYDYGSDVWTQLDVVGPSDRGWHAMALDADTGMLVLFGGGRSRDQYTAETWVFDLVANSWSRP